MKKCITSLFLLFGFFSLFSQVNRVDKVEGFKMFQFGDSFKDWEKSLEPDEITKGLTGMEGMVRLSGDGYYFVGKGPKSAFGKPLEKIKLYFRQDVLFQIELALAPESYIITELRAQLGEDFSEFAGEYSWRGLKVSVDYSAEGLADIVGDFRPNVRIQNFAQLRE